MKKSFWSLFAAALMLIAFGGCSSKSVYKPSTNTNLQKAVVYLYMPANLGIDDNKYNIYVNGYLMGQVGSNNYLPIEVPTGTIEVAIKHTDVVRAHREADTLAMENIMSAETYYVKAVVNGGPKLSRVDAPTGAGEVQSTYFIEQGMDVSKLGRQLRGEKVPLDMPRLLEPGAANLEPTAQTHQSVAAPQKADPAERLEKLFELKEKGAITEEEYNTLKAKIIAE